MEDYRFCHRVASHTARALACLVMAAASLASASAQTRIISLSGDLDFGRVPFHSSSQRTLAISNTGDSVLTVSNLVFPALPAFELVNFQGNWSGPLAPGWTRFVTITFTPLGTTDASTNDLNFQGSLVVESDATDGTNSIAMSGVGIWQPTNNIPALDFGPVPMGSSKQFMWSVTNQGNSPVTISNVSLPDSFWTTFWPPLTNNMIAPGSAANLIASFRPEIVGTQSGIITISSDASEPALVVVTPNGNNTNSTESFNQITVSGTGTYPAGKFIGLFAPTNNPAFENSGYFEATCTAKGQLRGTIILAGKRYPFAAKVSPSGAVSGTVVRKKSSNLNLSLQFNADYRLGWTGTIDDGVWSSALRADQAILLHKGLRRLVPSGDFTITFAGSTNSLLAPATPGAGTMRIKHSDATHVTGVLGDGTRYSQNTILCSGVPFYAPLYHNRGAILGWINFEYSFPNQPPPVILPPIHLPTPITNPPVVMPPTTITNVPIVILPINPGPGTNFPPIDITPIEIHPSGLNPSRSTSSGYKIVGTVNWFKPAGIDPDYPDGFSFQTTISGSVP